MPVTEAITETLVRDNIKRAVTDVFKTMLGQDPLLLTAPEGVQNQPWPPFGQSPENAPPIIAGTVGFLGDVNGMLYLYLDLSLAQMATSQLLGMTEQELDTAGDEVVNDAIGELTNMTVGSFKNGLCDAGYPCKLTIPSILRGNNFTIEPMSSTTRQTYYFRCAGQRLVADIFIKSE